MVSAAVLLQPFSDMTTVFVFEKVCCGFHQAQLLRSAECKQASLGTAQDTFLPALFRQENVPPRYVACMCECSSQHDSAKLNNMDGDESNLDKNMGLRECY